VSRHPEPRRPVRIVQTTRPGGGHRFLVVLDGPDARAYDHAVARLTQRIERSLGPGVLANRAVGRGTIATARLEPWRPAWQRWRRGLRVASGAPLLRMDVEGFYGSVGEQTLRRALGADADGVLDVLRALWNEGVRGLPVGPEPSAILANAVLASVDTAIRDAGVFAMRWVDDWVVPVVSTSAAGRTLVAAERGLRELRLELNLDKTSVRDPEAARGAFGPNGSGVPGPVRAMMPAP